MAVGGGLGNRGGPGGLRFGAFEANARSPGARGGRARRVRGPAALRGRGRAVGPGARLWNLGVFPGALQGASDAANWARGNGGAWSDRAWITVAAGAGVGFLIGFAADLAEAGRGWSPEPAAPPPCPAALAEPTLAAEGNMEREGTK